MNNLLKSDLYVIFKSKAFYISLIVIITIAISMPLLYGVIETQLNNLGQSDQEILEEIAESSREGVQGLSVGYTSSVITGKSVERTITWFTGQLLAGGELLFILVFFISNNMIKEYAYGTIKNKIAKGFSRTKIYLAKGTALSITTLIFITTMFLIGSLTTIIAYGISPVTMELFRILAIETLLYLAIVWIFMLVGSIFRRKVSMIITNILIVTAGSSILSLISMFIKDKIVLTRYWIPSNITEMGEIAVQSQSIERCVINVLITTIIVTIIGMQIFKKKDIH